MPNIMLLASWRKLAEMMSWGCLYEESQTHGCKISHTLWCYAFPLEQSQNEKEDVKWNFPVNQGKLYSLTNYSLSPEEGTVSSW